MHEILILDIAGVPLEWRSPRRTAAYYATGSVAWTLGDPCVVMTGGWQRSGQRSRMAIHPIVAIDGPARGWRLLEAQPNLSNQALFARDRQLCAYCGSRFGLSGLSRDHVMPLSKGGLDIWTNVVTACIGCNHRKAARTPEQAGMPLLYVPYAPSHHEALLLAGRRILADQLDYLMLGIGPDSRLRC